MASNLAPSPATGSLFRDDVTVRPLVLEDHLLMPSRRRGACCSTSRHAPLLVAVCARHGGRIAPPPPSSRHPQAHQYLKDNFKR